LVPESWAVRIEDLEPGRAWRLRAVAIAGYEKLARGELKIALLTQMRPWYRFWSERPVFDPVTFQEDLERLRRLYEARGFYHAEIDYDLALDRDTAC
jgi:outer membrane protein assembly factor BamA